MRVSSCQGSPYFANHSPPLKKTCVGQAVLDKWLPLINLQQVPRHRRCHRVHLPTSCCDRLLSVFASDEHPDTGIASFGTAAAFDSGRRRRLGRPFLGRPRPRRPGRGREGGNKISCGSGSDGCFALVACVVTAHSRGFVFGCYLCCCYLFKSCDCLLDVCLLLLLSVVVVVVVVVVVEVLFAPPLTPEDCRAAAAGRRAPRARRLATAGPHSGV